MRAILSVLLASTPLVLAGVAVAQQPRVQPIASVKQLMEAMIIPSSDALFSVAVEAPNDEQKWAAVRNSAVILAESGNLLMIGSRTRDEEAWMTMSRELVDAGAIALKAAEAKDVDALVDAGNEIAGVCEACHEQYLNKGSQNR